MPPADFWMYARTEQQKYNDLLDRKPQTVWPDARPARPRALSHVLANDASTQRCPSAPMSPAKVVLRPNMNKGNIMRAGGASYESVRKDRGWDDGGKQDVLFGNKEKKRYSRTLVKKRQPWDQEPRRESSRS